MIAPTYPILIDGTWVKLTWPELRAKIGDHITDRQLQGRIRKVYTLEKLNAPLNYRVATQNITYSAKASTYRKQG